MKKIDELRQERFKLTKDAEKVILDLKKLPDGSPEWTADTRTKYDAIMKDVDEKKVQIDELAADEKRAAAPANILKELSARSEAAIIEDIGGENREDPAIEKALLDKNFQYINRSTLRKWMSVFDSNEYRNAFEDYLCAVVDNGIGQKAVARSVVGKLMEARALQMDLDAAGGYTVVPQQFVAELIEAMKAVCYFRAVAKTYTCANAESLGAPALFARPADPTWTTEILTGNTDSTMQFGKRELHPHPLAENILISKKLIRASALNVDAVVRDQLAYKLAIVEEYAFLNGTGVNQPLGVFTASALGIDTSRDVSTSNTTTTITADGLIECKYTLRPTYWPRAKWIFNPAAIKNIRKLRGNDGDFLWKAGLAGDGMDTLLNHPLLISEFAPSTFTTGLYVGILGVFDYYYIADALDVTIQVLTELYAATNQNGYIIRKETDGMPVLAEAFVRVALA